MQNSKRLDPREFCATLTVVAPMHEAESPEDLPSPPVKSGDEHPYAIFRNRDFTLYLAGRLVAVLVISYDIPSPARATRLADPAAPVRPGQPISATISGKSRAYKNPPISMTRPTISARVITPIFRRAS